MTRNEALRIFKDIDFNLHSTYLEGFGYDDCATIEDKINEFDFEALIDYFCSLDLPFDVVKEFVNGDITFADMNGEATGDEWDYLNIYKNEDGSLGMYVWTEVAGITYDLKDYNKTWRERKHTEEENSERKEMFSKEVMEEFNALIKGMVDRVLPEVNKETDKEAKE